MAFVCLRLLPVIPLLFLNLILAAQVPAPPDSAAGFFGSFIGSAGDDNGTSVTLINDIVYVTGTTQDSTFPVTAGALQPTFHGARDIFVSAFDTSGALLWSTFLGGSNDELLPQITGDSISGLVITGYTNSADFPVTPNAHQDSIHGSYDLFISRLSLSGQMIWSTYYGGNGADLGIDITLSADGSKIIIGGQSSSTDLLTTTGVHQPAYNGAVDAILLVMDTAGLYQWATYFGGTGTEDIHAVNISGQDIIFTGMTNSTDLYYTPGAIQPGLAGMYDVYIARFNMQGAVVWSTYFGTSGMDDANGIAADSAGNVYITGYTSAGDLPVTNDAWQANIWGSHDIFVAGTTPTGALRFCSYLGGEGYESGVSLKYGNDHTLYLVADSNSDSLPAYGIPPDTVRPGGYDCWIYSFSVDFEPMFASWFGGTGNDLPASLAFADSMVVIAGSTNSGTLPFTGTSVFQPSASGNQDAFWSLLRMIREPIVDTTDTGINPTGETERGKFRVYPNPASGHFSIECDSCRCGEIKLSDLSGRLVRTWDIAEMYSVEGLSPGLYILHADHPECTWSAPLLVRSP